MREKLQKIQVKRLVILNLPYFFIFYVADKGSWLYRHCLGESMVQRLGVMLVNFRLAFLSWLPSIALQDLTVGVLVAGALKLVVYYRSKNAKKFRQGVEYGSAIDQVLSGAFPLRCACVMDCADAVSLVQEVGHVVL